jgi:hypothetical protein
VTPPDGAWRPPTQIGTCGSAAWPAGDAVTACLAAARELQDGQHSVLEQHRREVQRARCDATKAEPRYLAVDAENRLVAKGLETARERALTALAAAEAELGRREAQQPKTLTAEQQTRILALGTDLDVIWSAPTTTDRARNSSAPCSPRSPSAWTGPPATPTSCSAGRAAPSPTCGCR